MGKFLIADETGCMVFTAWNDELDMIELDKVYKIWDGYIKRYKGS